MERPQRRWCEPEGVWHVGSTKAAPRQDGGRVGIRGTDAWTQMCVHFARYRALSW